MRRDGVEDHCIAERTNPGTQIIAPYAGGKNDPDMLIKAMMRVFRVLEFPLTDIGQRVVEAGIRMS